MNENSSSERANRATVPLPQESVYFEKGTMIGDYTIDSLLHVGSQATLFAVTKENRKYVMRVSFIGEEPDMELMNLLGRENSKHLPLIVSGRHKEHFYGIMPEYKDLPAEMTDSEKVDFIIQATGAIDSLHKLGFVHNDIKPEHFMRKSDGTIVLIDFGNATKVGVRPKHTSVFMAKEAYASPLKESDYFSLGCSLIDMFTSAFHGKSRREIIEMISKADNLKPFLQDQPSTIRDCIMWLLTDNPAVRRERLPVYINKTNSDVAYSPAIIRPVNDSISIKDIKKSIADEFYNLILKADPNLVRKAQNAFVSVDVNNIASLSGFLNIIKMYPRSQSVVNYTNISRKQAFSLLKKSIVINQKELNRANPVKSLRRMEKKAIPYIYNSELIDSLDTRGADINNKRNERDWQILRIIGIIIGTLAAVAAVIAIVVAIVIVLFYIIVAIIIICVIGAALSG